MANITGNYPDVQRVETGFWSLDNALGGNSGLGVPMTFIEIFGYQGIGKSVFASFLMAEISKHYQKKSVYLPFEDIDVTLLGQIMDFHGNENEVSMLGTWESVKKFFKSFEKKKDTILTDELMIDCFLEAARSLDYCVGVVDSLTTFVSIAEMESSVADRNMGRARVISVFSRSMNQIKRGREDSPFATIVLSHKFQPMGGGAPSNTGSSTTGGEIKKDVSKVRISLRRLPENSFEMDSQKNIYEEQAYVLEGRVEKNGFGRDDKKFYVVMLGGKGAHRGLTAVYECKRMKLATFGKSVTLGKDKFGSLYSLIQKAHAGETEIFQPFIDALNNPDGFEKMEEPDPDAEAFIDEMPE